jgi:hypothetical protein
VLGLQSTLFYMHTVCCADIAYPDVTQRLAKTDSVQTSHQ